MLEPQKIPIPTQVAWLLTFYELATEQASTALPWACHNKKKILL